jgi:hypothetical protein
MSYLKQEMITRQMLKEELVVHQLQNRLNALCLRHLGQGGQSGAEGGEGGDLHIPRFISALSCVGQIDVILRIGK